MPGCIYIQGILSSKLLVWLFKFEKNEFDDLFPKIRLEEFKKLPIPQEPKYVNEIEHIVREILTLKNLDPLANTNVQGTEIDRLVYELYGLAEEEIQIVENS
ncbi:MAG: hypothetical protein ABIJ04_04550 [Bacteroidota bacterium]